jgi:FtsP/CotA-like multicopper oxidase with cupredoxin domain
VKHITPTRRAILKGLAASSLLLRSGGPSAAEAQGFRLTPQATEAPVGGASAIAVWAYNGTIPGPELRVRQGSRLKVVVENRLTVDTTVHWHGIRLPNAMDGVPHLTQAPIAPGQTFRYEFEVPDAGTYWYHPHLGSPEQVGRGLAGALIVEEREPIAVDRDVTLLLSDWRLLSSGQISGDFRNLRDMTHAGRIGNVVTVNGKAAGTAFSVRTGERVRLRILNAANARIFGLTFAGHSPTVIAYDGQPVAPHAPDGGRIVLGPGMRADVVLDMTGKPGDRFNVTDSFYERHTYRLLELAYADRPLRDKPREDAMALAANVLPELDLASAERHELTFNGGMMGGMMMRGGGGPDMMEMMRAGKVWFINGVSQIGHVHAPMLSLARGRSCVLAMSNETAWWHPMHLHGHVFRVLSRNGTPTRHRPWADTVLIAPREKVEVAFVADNPGDWMFHCHVLEHQESGMMGVIRVA